MLKLKAKVQFMVKSIKKEVKRAPFKKSLLKNLNIIIKLKTYIKIKGDHFAALAFV